jgi:hypothetical protein
MNEIKSRNRNQQNGVQRSFCTAAIQGPACLLRVILDGSGQVGTPGALLQATRTVPIVFVIVIDPVGGPADAASHRRRGD